MQALLFITLGVIIGSIVTRVIIRFRSGRGYFIITEVSPEDDLYSVNVRLINGQNLHKVKRIILSREHADDISQK